MTMSALEPTHDEQRTDEEGDAEAVRVIELSTDAGTARVSLPPTADAGETAAIAAAVHAHLDGEDGGRDADERTDRWKLAGRLGVRSPRRIPDCRRGDEWKAAARPY